MSSRSLNRVQLIGNVGRDAETAYTASGTAISKFSVATNRRWKDQQTDEWKEEVNFTNCVAWKMEKVCEYVRKGTKLYVEGRLQNRSYTDKEGVKKYVTEVIVDEIILLDNKGQREVGGDEENLTSRPRSAAAPASRQQPPQQSDYIDDGDVPF